MFSEPPNQPSHANTVVLDVFSKGLFQIVPPVARMRTLPTSNDKQTLLFNTGCFCGLVLPAVFQKKQSVPQNHGCLWAGFKDDVSAARSLLTLATGIRAQTVSSSGALVSML